MKVFLIFAHPESHSLGGALFRASIDALQAAGHEVQTSDLYRMGWKACADAADFPNFDPAERLVYHQESGIAYAAGSQAPDIAEEQRKLLWADTVIFQFPIWWFGMPAILKGWFDRVYAFGLAYGRVTRDPITNRVRSERYGEGGLAGKRAMLIVTTGGLEKQYAARGINGPMSDVLYPIHHGLLWYPGMAVLPPFVVYRASLLKPDGFESTRAELAARLENIQIVTPIPYRSENGGHYDADLKLDPDLAPGAYGFDLHVKKPGERPETGDSASVQS